jgi:competence protein ComGF
MRLTNLFKSKDNKLKAAFRAIKADMDFMDHSHNALKDSTNEWIIFLDQENRDLKARVRELEKKLDNLNDSLDEQELSVLRTI